MGKLRPRKKEVCCFLDVSLTLSLTFYFLLVSSGNVQAILYLQVVHPCMARANCVQFCSFECKTRTIQNSISKQITFTDGTILNACPGKSARCVPPYHTPSISSPKVI